MVWASCLVSPGSVRWGAAAAVAAAGTAAARERVRWYKEMNKTIVTKETRNKRSLHLVQGSWNANVGQ